MIVRDRIFFFLLVAGVVAGAAAFVALRNDDSPDDMVGDVSTTRATPAAKNDDVRRRVEIPRATSLPVDIESRPAPAESRPAVNGGLVIVRVIVHGTKEPVSGVKVRVFGPKRPWRGAVLGEGVTDDKGRARLEGLPEGELAIEVVSKEWAPRACLKAEIRRIGRRRFWVDAPTRAKVASITVPVLRRFAIEGVVVDQDGIPVSDVSIRVDDPAQQGDLPQEMIEPTLTDKDGRFRLEELAYSVAVQLDAHSPLAALDEPVWLEPLPGETIGGLRVVVHRYEWIDCTVLLRAPMPLALGGVKVIAGPLSGRSGPIAPVLTDPFGKAVVQLERATRYLIHVDPATLPQDVMIRAGDGSSAFRANPSENTEYVVRLDAAFSLHGRVKTEDGKPVGGGTLVFVARGDNSRTFSATTNPDGVFRLKVPTEGPYDIVEGFAWVRTNDTEGKFSVVKATATTITPRTLIAGAPVEPVEIVVD